MSEAVKEILEKYEVRKTKKQKSAFIEYALGFAERNGYSAKVEENKKGVKNIVVGNPEKASVIYTAHYDTCPRLPFPNFITPKNMLIYIVYQLFLTVLIIGIPTLAAIGLGALLSSFSVDESIVSIVKIWTEYIGIIALLYLMMKGPANPHTANDNTSGVSTLVSIMETLPENLRENVAFIFFDLEEVGLVGSSVYYKAHKSKMQNKLLLNFDCVSDGKTILFAIKKDAAAHLDLLKASFIETDTFTPDFATKGVFYPSDQAKFPMGVGVAALKKSKRGTLYMNRIHTAKDTVFDEENIAYLAHGAVKLVEFILKNEQTKSD